MIGVQQTWRLLLLRLRLQPSGLRRRFLMMQLDQLDPLPLGPGWFDSSWDLGKGLEVREDVELDAAQRVRLEDVMIAAALARLRTAAARCGKPSGAVSQSLAAPPAEPRLEVCGFASAGRTDNLIEFDLADAGSWSLPARQTCTRAPGCAELELSLV